MRLEGVRTLSKLIDRLDESIGHGDLSGAFRNQFASLREQTEAVEAEFQEIEARIYVIAVESSAETIYPRRWQINLRHLKRMFLKRLV